MRMIAALIVLFVMAGPTGAADLAIPKRPVAATKAKPALKGLPRAVFDARFGPWMSRTIWMPSPAWRGSGLSIVSGAN